MLGIYYFLQCQGQPFDSEQWALFRLEIGQLLAKGRRPVIFSSSFLTLLWHSCLVCSRVLGHLPLFWLD